MSSSDERQSTTASSETTTTTTTAEQDENLPLDVLIDHQRWNQVEAYLLRHPEATQSILHSTRGWYPLHWLCAIGSTPTHLIELALKLSSVMIANVKSSPPNEQPHWIAFAPDGRFQDTPLHLVCRHAQVTAGRALAVIRCFAPGSKHILARNSLGGTALHTAVNHNAVLPVIRAMVRVNPAMVQVKTHDGIHVITALWNSYLQTIQGHMCVARALESSNNSSNDKVTDGHFVRFWHKVQFLALAQFRQSDACPDEYKKSSSNSGTLETKDDHDGEEASVADNNNKFIIHALLQCNVNIKLYQLALKLHPEGARVPNAQGYLPLHSLIQDRHFRLKERQAILSTLEAYPDAAGYCGSEKNNHGATQYPLLLAIRNKIPWESGVDCLLHAARFVIEQRSTPNNLFPFQVAAATGGHVSINTTFHLLSARPDLLLREP